MEWVELLLPYAKSLGAVTFAAVGNCWGGYMVMRLSSYAEFKAGKHSIIAYSVIGWRAPVVLQDKKESHQKILASFSRTKIAPNFFIFMSEGFLLGFFQQLSSRAHEN
jgi:hypothetical protein